MLSLLELRHPSLLPSDIGIGGPGSWPWSPGLTPGWRSFGLLYATSFPGPPACRQQITAHLSLHNCVSQFP